MQGVDDVLAMLLALSASPEELIVELISVTYGNVEVEKFVCPLSYLSTPSSCGLHVFQTFRNASNVSLSNSEYFLVVLGMSSPCSTKSRRKWRGERVKEDLRDSRC
jgi:hypothetical protein